MNSARDARSSSRTSGHAFAALRRLVAGSAADDGELLALVGGSAGFSDGGGGAELVAGPATASACRLSEALQERVYEPWQVLRLHLFSGRRSCWPGLLSVCGGLLRRERDRRWRVHCRLQAYFAQQLLRQSLDQLLRYSAHVVNLAKEG